MSRLRRVKRFSDRMGITQVRRVLQVDALDEPSRTALWNMFLAAYEDLEEAQQYGDPSYQDGLLRAFWVHFLEQPLDRYGQQNTYNLLRQSFFDLQWWDCLNSLQFVVPYINDVLTDHGESEVWGSFNTVFEAYLVNYRFVDGEIVPVGSTHEVDAVEEALSVGGPARLHLERALSSLSNRANPQYAKVVHEAMNAVESIVRESTGASTLGKGLDALRADGVPMHKALVAGLDKLYGYTSSDAGIRHALIGDDQVDEATATFFVTACAAFINLIVKAMAKR